MTEKPGEQPWPWWRAGSGEDAAQADDVARGSGDDTASSPPSDDAADDERWPYQGAQASDPGQPWTGAADPYGQPPHGQPWSEEDPYGQPSYGQPWSEADPYGQPPYGQPPHGQPWSEADPYGQPPHGQPWSEADPYGQPPYSQPPYRQPGYGQPGYGPPARRRAGRRLAVAAGVGGLLAAAVAGGVVGHALTAADRSTTASGSATSPSSGGFGFGGAGGSGSGSGNSLSPGAGNGSGGGFPYAGGSGSTTPSGSGTGPSDAAAIAARVDPGLVDINTVVDYGQERAAGTGMILTAGGEVLTNNHVIEGATTISVTDVGNGQTYQATVVGYSVTSDVAVLRLVGAAGLQTVRTSSAAPAVGEQVVGIGNAGGAGGTPSYAGGAVTAIDQSITASDDLTGSDEQLTGMIETNADIQAGDSGGPLVNDSGQVIGMDTAGSQSGQFAAESQGSGYAIPIATATSIASQIVAGDASSSVHVGPTAFLGIQVGQASTGGFGPGDGYGYGANPGSGVPIAAVIADGPAAGAGLVAGDVITSVGGYAVTSQPELQQVLTTDLSPGQVVTVRYTGSAGQQQSVTLTLASGPAA